MLSIVINNRPVSLNRDFSVRIEWVNPACFMDDIPGPIGLGIELPVNEINRMILGNPERFEKYSIGNDRKFSGAEIRYAGTLLLSGTLVINKATQESYSGWLQSELGVMGEEQREKFISDLDWPTEQTFVNNGYNPGYNDETDDYGVKYIRNAGFWDGKGKEVTVDIPYLDQNGLPKTKEETGSALMASHYDNFQYMVNAYAELDAITVTGDGCVVSPFLFLRYVIKEALRLNSWFIDRNDMIGEGDPGYSLSFWKNMMVYNNFNIINPTFQTADIHVPDWDSDLRSYIDNEVTQITWVSWDLDQFDYKDMVPKISMKNFLLGIQNTLNMIFVFDRFHKVHIIDRNEILNQTPIDLDTYKLGFWDIGEKKQVTLKFMPEYDKEDTLFGAEFNDLSDRRDDFADPVDTYEDLLDVVSPEYGELRLVKNLNKIYEYKLYVFTIEDANRVENQIDTLGWEFISSGPQPFMYGNYDEIEEIKSPLSTLQKNPVLEFYEAHQKGNLGKMRSVWADFSFRILDFNELLFPGALYWEGEYGLFEKRWKNWARFWSTRLPVEGEFDLPLNVLMNVVSNIFNPFRESKGGFIIETMETEFGLYTIGKTRIKGYKI